MSWNTFDNLSVSIDRYNKEKTAMNYARMVNAIMKSMKVLNVYSNKKVDYQFINKMNLLFRRYHTAKYYDLDFDKVLHEINREILKKINILDDAKACVLENKPEDFTHFLSQGEFDLKNHEDVIGVEVRVV